MSLGGYQWVAAFRDGTVLQQYHPETGQELSIDRVQEHLRAMRQAQPESGEETCDAVLDLHPLKGAPHNFTRIEIRAGEELIKHWTVSVTMQGNVEVAREVVDSLGLRPSGRSRRAVRVFAFPDGSIKITTAKEADALPAWFTALFAQAE